MHKKTNVKEANEEKFWLTKDNEVIAVPRGSHHCKVVDDYEGGLRDGWVRVLVTNDIIHCNCHEFDNHKYKNIYTLVQKHDHFKKLPVMIIDDKTQKTLVYKAGMKEEMKRYKRPKKV